MAKKFPVLKYAQLEMNRAAFLKNGLVVSQTPLSNEFTEAAPCENGMWVDADKANGAIKKISAETTVFGIVYTTETDKQHISGSLNAQYSVEGDYPRVGIMQKGDTFTTNCFDLGDYTEVSDLETAVKSLPTTPLYVEGVAGDGRPKVTATKPSTAFYGKVIGYTTMPNGEKAIKYTIVVA